MKTTFIKSVLSSLMVALLAMTTHAQSFEKGDKLLNVGVGLGSQFLASGAKGMPPVGLSFEVGVSDKISVGAYGGYASAKLDWGFGGEWKYSYILAAARGSYHFDFNVENLDPYVGAMLGYNIASVKVNNDTPAGASAGGVLWGAHAGARYYFSPKVGVFGEVGYGVAWLNLGLAFKL